MHACPVSIMVTLSNMQSACGCMHVVELTALFTEVNTNLYQLHGGNWGLAHWLHREGGLPSQAQVPLY